MKALLVVIITILLSMWMGNEPSPFFVVSLFLVTVLAVLFGDNIPEK